MTSYVGMFEHICSKEMPAWSGMPSSNRRPAELIAEVPQAMILYGLIVTFHHSITPNQHYHKAIITHAYHHTVTTSHRRSITPSSSHHCQHITASHQHTTITPSHHHITSPSYINITLLSEFAVLVHKSLPSSKDPKQGPSRYPWQANSTLTWHQNTRQLQKFCTWQWIG